MTSAAPQQKTVPLVSSGTAGPLGAIHLPRLWAKLTLGSAGKLADGYDECGQGFDQMTIDALGLEREDVIAFVRESHPTYMQFEAYVREHGSPTPAAIEQHNAAIRGYDHADDLGSQMRASAGVTDHGIKDAVSLNGLEDLDELHKQTHAG